MPLGDPVTEWPRMLLVAKGLDLGGIERIVVDLAVGLSARGIDVEVAVVNSDRRRLIPTLEEAGITVHRLHGTDLIGFAASRRLLGLIRGGRFDVIHVHGPLPAVVARLAAIGVGTQVITTSHTPWPSLRWATRVGWRVTARLDAASLAVSSTVAASLPKSAHARVTVVPHGVDPARIAAAQQLDRPRATGPVTVVTVASHRDAKNYPNLLRSVRVAIESGADLRLVAIGDGPNVDADRALACILGIDDAVVFMPANEEALHHVACADLLVVASDYEGQPIVVAEALALGVPVVATAVGRVPETVDDSVGRVVPHRDPAALGGALAELANDATLRTQLIGNARRRGVRTLDDVIDAHLAVYGNVNSSNAAWGPFRRSR